MRRLSLILLTLMASSSVYAQTTPAQMGITPTTVPEVLQVLDNTRTWVTIGNVDPGAHAFSVIGGHEADILVTDPTVGMAAATATSVIDNAPFVANLMNKMGPPNPYVSGYDVTFPAVPGQNYTEYYFSQPLVLSRGANYHCSGTTYNSGTYLVFAPGIDNVIQESYNLTVPGTTTGGAGKGSLSGCSILDIGTGSATANPITSTVLTGVSFNADPAGLIPKSTWSVGDGIFLTAANGFFPTQAIPGAPIGTTITAIDGATGNLTLSNPVSSYLGAKGGGSLTNSTATFTETGTNNFVANDTIKVGANTWKFVTGLLAAYNVTIGPDFPTSAKNLVAAINNTAGQNVTYWPDTTGPNAYGSNNLDVTASYVPGSGQIVFKSIYSGPATNQFPSVYTPAGTAAGTFGGATFTGANDATSCAAPCTAQNVSVGFFQFPASQAYKVRTTIGSNSVTVISGPRPLQPADVIWSDAFPFGSAINSATYTGFPQTITINTPVMTAVQNATVTHAPGAEGSLWVMTASLKRRTFASAEHNHYGGSPIGLHMACLAGPGINCDGSRDRDNWYQGLGVGRWAIGGNYSSSSSIDELFSGNNIADIFEGGTLGEVYVNPNSNSVEGGAAKWAFIMNCPNQNYTTIFGGYLAMQPGGNGCANQTSIYPPTPGGPLLFGALASSTNGPGLTRSTWSGIYPVTYRGGNDNNLCITSGPGAPANGTNSLMSFGTCSFSFTVGYNALLGSIDFMSATTPLLRLINVTSLGYTGYAGPGYGVAVPNGVILGGDGNTNPNNFRYFGTSLGATAPASSWHLRGDTQINAVSSAGGMAGWYSAAGSSSFTGQIAGTALTVQQEIDPTPLPTIATGGAGSGYAPGSSNVTGTMTGTFAGCSTEPVLNVTATGTTGAIQSVNSVTTKGVCSAVPANAPWTPGGALSAGTGASFNITWEQAGLSGAVAIGQTLTGTGVTAGTKITAGSGSSFTVNNSQTVGPITITGSSWVPMMPVSNDPNNPDYTATTIRSGSSANKDLTGRITLAAGTATYTLVGVYASAPDCITADVTTPANVSSVVESTTALTFTGTGTDVIKYICAGRN